MGNIRCGFIIHNLLSLNCNESIVHVKYGRLSDFAIN